MNKMIPIILGAGLAGSVIAAPVSSVPKSVLPQTQPVAQLVKAVDLDQLAAKGSIKANQLIVKYKAGEAAPASFTDAYIKSIKSFISPKKYLKQKQALLSQFKIITVSDGQSLNNAYQSFVNDPSVEAVMPNFKISLASTVPNDMTSSLWGLSNTGQQITVGDETFAGSVDADIDAPEAWDIQYDASSVVVAVIDTGVDYTHPDLAANIWTNSGEIAGNGIDDDNNGYIDDVHGYSFSEYTTDPMDDNGHGTHCSGTIGAVGNNSIGITGVAWNVQIMPVKILDAYGYGYMSEAINGILYAADNGAKVANNSYGFTYPDSVYADMTLAPLKDVLVAANDVGMLMAVAAGNDGFNFDSGYFHVPANIPLPNILSVAATDYNDELADFSNYGSHGADLAAPGVNIYSTLPGNEYGFYSGTSMATPHVTGAAALLLAKRPDLTPAEVRTVLMQSSDQVSALQGKVKSNGRLNIHNALVALDDVSCPVFVATPSQHKSAGRAHSCGFFNMYICANGSNEQIGSGWTSTDVTLTEHHSGYYVTDGSCGGQLNFAPSISLAGSDETYIKVGGQFSFDSYSATDREDGNLTASVQVTENVNTDQAGDYVVTYEVSDSGGKTSVKETRLVHVIEASIPRIIFLGDGLCALPGYCGFLPIPQNQPYVDPGFIGYDLIDGDISDQVVLDGSAVTDTSVIGEVSAMKFHLTNSAGYDWPYTEDIYRRLIVIHQELPFPYLGPTWKEMTTYSRTETEGHPVYPMPPNMYAFDIQDGPFYGDIQMNDTTDYSTAGDYQVIFSVADSEGNIGTNTAIVHVIDDVTPPEVNMLGDVDEYVVVNTEWNDSGVWPKDDLDPNPQKSREGEVDVTVIGDYVLNYTVWDASGNEAYATRTVHIIDASAPEITSSGATPGQRTMTVQGTAFDADDDIVKVEIRLHCHETEWVTAEGTTNWSYTYNDIEPAFYNVEIRATDSTGLESEFLQGSLSGVRVWDPIIESFSIFGGPGTLELQGTASDGNGDLSEIWLYVTDPDGIETTYVAQGTYSWSLTLEGLAEGEYSVQARAIDAASHWGDKTGVKTAEVAPGVECYTDTNANHAAAGRAYVQWNVLYYSTGGADYLGLSSNQTSVEKDQSGNWQKVTSCP